MICGDGRRCVGEIWGKRTELYLRMRRILCLILMVIINNNLIDMKKVFMSMLMLFAGIVATFAEDLPEITFETITHDFGTFPEENGKVSCVFEFTNTGKADLVLQKVRASCGCTTPEWTKEPVKPGEKGTVKATYNASGRPGAFSKTITVTTNAGEKRLSIKGEVIPKAQKVEDKYPHDYDGFRMLKKNVYFNTVFNPDTKIEKIEVINNGTKDVKVTFENAPKFVAISCPPILKPGDKGEVIFTIKTKDSDVWGAFKETAIVVVNGKAFPENPVTMFGTVAENFSNMTAEEKANAPVLTLGNAVSLGKIKTTTAKTYEITVKNDGKSPLIIRAINVDSKNITATLPAKIKPGKTGAIRIKVNGAGLKVGKFTQRMTVTTNDPNRSTYIVNLNGEVE